MQLRSLKQVPHEKRTVTLQNLFRSGTVAFLISARLRCFSLNVFIMNFLLMFSGHQSKTGSSFCLCGGSSHFFYSLFKGNEALKSALSVWSCYNVRPTFFLCNNGNKRRYVPHGRSMCSWRPLSHAEKALICQSSAATRGHCCVTAPSQGQAGIRHLSL